LNKKCFNSVIYKYEILSTFFQTVAALDPAKFALCLLNEKSFPQINI